MKGLALKMPDELLCWIREKAARETINRGRQVSMNTVILELLGREMEADEDRPKVLTGHECQGYG